MFEPDSTWLIVLLFLVAAGLLVGIVRWQHLILRIVAGVCVLLLASVGGMTAVNKYYGYYRTWGELSADFSGSYQSFGAAPEAAKRGATKSRSGRIVSLMLAGKESHIDRRGFVLLPPQYNQPAYAHTEFPVVELFHGTPGQPGQWLDNLNLAHVVQKLMTDRLIGPMIFVMPNISGQHYEECVNGQYGQDETYVVHDVRQDILARFRASAMPAEWGVAGYSSGGYCAANLALRDRTEFGAAGIMDGYFRPKDGPAADALGNNAADEDANNPLLLARALTATTSPLPALWLSAGTAGKGDLAGARAFVQALHGIEGVPLTIEPGAGHNFYAWAGVLPRLFSWMWPNLAPPSLRVEFPVAGRVSSSDVVAPTNPFGTHGGHRSGSTTPSRSSSAHARAGRSVDPSPTTTDSHTDSSSPGVPSHSTRPVTSGSPSDRNGATSA